MADWNDHLMNAVRSMGREADAQIMRIQKERDNSLQRTAEYRDECNSLRNENTALRNEIENLKDLLNKGHESLMKENEQLRWACAIKDAELYQYKDLVNLMEKKRDRETRTDT